MLSRRRTLKTGGPEVSRLWTKEETSRRKLGREREERSDRKGESGTCSGTWGFFRKKLGLKGDLEVMKL